MQPHHALPKTVASSVPWNNRDFSIMAATHWQEVTSFTTEFNHGFAKYRSSRTGLTFILANVDGPIVHGFFVLATEALDNDGCPHTLEHLVFLGSEEFPFKGVLDRLANRALAQGTNAWTDTDHTCYTITTAGREGFLNVLPVYLDHILYPTLTDSGCYTEVHHINDEGANAGVVYSEMQGRENSSSDRLHRRMLELLYPEGCGYRSETGGLMANLRALHVDKIRDYHKSYYRPDNLCVIITGNVPAAEVFKALEAVEEKIVSKGKLPQMKRPWVESAPIPPLTSSVTETVEFPEENDTTIGEVLVAWRGPLYTAFEEKDGLDILTTYLTDSAVSLLRKHFCEIDEPLCSSVDLYTIENFEGVVYANFSNVPTDKLEEIQPLLHKVLSEHVESNAFDMPRIKLLLSREKLKRLSKAETSPHDTYATAAIVNHLYGALDGSQIKQSLPTPGNLDVLESYTANQWIALTKKFFLDRPFICVRGLPSPRLAKELTETEAQRIAKQREDLGETKLKELAVKLAEANHKNNMEVPADVINRFDIPSLDTISLVPVISSRRDSNSPSKLNPVQHKIQQDQPEKPLGIDIQFDHVSSAFIEIRVLIDTADIPLKNRLWLSVLAEGFFETAIKRDGVVISYEEVVKQLDTDTVKYEAYTGINGRSFIQWFIISIKVEASKYPIGVRWLHDLLFHAHYSSDRLKTIVSKLLQDIPSQKRDGMTMATTAMRLLAYDPEKSNHVALSAIEQQAFLASTLKRLGGSLDLGEEEEEEKEEETKEHQEVDVEVSEEEKLAAVAEVDALLKAMSDPTRMIVQVVGNILDIPSPRQPWLDVFGHFNSSAVDHLSSPPDSVCSHRHRSLRGKNPNNTGILVEISAIESSFSLHAAPGIQVFNDADVGAFMVLNEYLSMMEGVFWKKVRGLGLAYSCSTRTDIDQGLVIFVVYRSADCSKAFAQVKGIIEDMVAGTLPFDDADVLAAKAGALFSVIEREDTVSAASMQSFINQVLKRVGSDGTQKLLHQIRDTTVESMRRILSRYVQHIFRPESSISAIASAPGKSNDIANGFKKLGYHIESIDNADRLSNAIAELSSKN